MSSTTINLLEEWSNIAQILSVLFLIFSLLIMWHDIKIRSRREAGQVSISQAEKYAKEILPRVMKIGKDLKSKGIVLENKKAFTAVELDKELKSLNKTESDTFNKTIKVLKEDKYILTDIQNLLNELEAISLVFISGIGDESVVFYPMSKSFCNIIEQYYFIIALNRGEETGYYYTNLIKLYKIWSSRIKKEQLLTRIWDMSREFKSIKLTKIDTIGS